MLTGIDYQRGYVDGLRTYAWWKDGVQHVGTCGTTLEVAIERFLVEAGPPPGLHEPDLLEALQIAYRTIRILHGQPAWDIYRMNAPEMQTINTAITNATGEPVEAGEEQA